MTVRLLFTVVIPLADPIDTAVAAPAIFTVVAFALNKLAVASVVVRSPPFNARSPVKVRPAKEGESVVATD